MPNYFLFSLLLIAALSHAISHGILKQNKNPLGIMGLGSIIELIIFIPLVFLVPFPTSYIWSLIVASVFLHGFYRLLVVYSYKFGDLSFVYPVARGGSSLLLITISLIYLSDNISLIGFIAILIISFGLFFISYSKKETFNKAAFILGCFTALMITAYTLIDGIGVRSSNNSYTFLFWLLALNGIPALIASLLFKGKGLRNINKDLLKKGIGFGVLAPLAYGLVIWSMQYLPIAYASAIRETSIIFATLFGFVFLQEKGAKTRVLPAICVVIGISILYFQL
jgi:drug/metabolite transporter (DMT)-like permease